MQIKKYFKRKRIVHTRILAPGELLFTFTHKDNVYVRIRCTKMVKGISEPPVTDVKFSDVTGIQIFPSPVERWFYKILHIKPKAKMFTRKKG